MRLSAMLMLIGVSMFVIAGCPGDAFPPGNNNGVGNANGNANGNVNGNVNGNANGNANGNINGNANGNANGNVNGNDNGAGNDNANGNGNDNGDGEEVVLSEITFQGDVIAGVDPVEFEIGGGSILFQGGRGGTTGLTALYSSGTFAYLMSGGNQPVTITFNDLRVVRLDFYFADAGAPGATLVARDESGAAIDTADSTTTGVFADPNGFVTIEGNGSEIASLTIEAPAGVTMTIDDLQLTVIE